MSSASEIVNKVWNYAHVLRDDGVGYGDYVEQITFLIFLKMADERNALTPTLSRRADYRTHWTQRLEVASMSPCDYTGKSLERGWFRAFAMQLLLTRG